MGIRAGGSLSLPRTGDNDRVIDSVDPAVLRTGRMDQFIYIGLPEDAAACEKVVRACLRKTPSIGINFRAIAEWCHRRHLTPADMAGMCKLAGKNAVIDHLDLKR